MTDILLSGCNGKMGRVITACVAEREDCRIVAGIDLNTRQLADFPVFASPADVTVKADVIIDFSNPSVVTPLLDYACTHSLPAVVATTGLSEEQVGVIHRAAETIPVFFSANMSLGVNLLVELAKIATRVLGSSFDIEIIEMHHNQKLDAPSGTALMIADQIAQECDRAMHYEYDRHSKRCKRDRNEIGIHAVRGGTIVGEHEVLFAGHDELITLSHSARSKEIFATGSINAAIYLHKKPAGLYSMADLVEGKEQKEGPTNE